MSGLGRQLGLVVFAGLMCALTGCLQSANPSYWPYLLPPGHVREPHAKPPGFGNYANFDPYSIRLEVRPIRPQANPVNTQYVIVATVYNGDGPDAKPLRSRRIDWYLKGAGQIIEVDESGYFNGRGGKDGTNRAWSYTNFTTHTMTRFNLGQNDDFVLRPGQSYCVISSPTEGDSYITVMAPEIANWDKRLKVVHCHWVDADWRFPAPATARTGSKHTFVTEIYRRTDGQPLANYRVRYRILNGPPAGFLPEGKGVAEVKSDSKGRAEVDIVQSGPAAGVNTVEIEILRPPDPTKPSAAAISVAKATTSIEWLAPQMSVTNIGPQSALLGQDVTFNVAIANTGKIGSDLLLLKNPVPDGLFFVRSVPPAVVDGNNLVFTLSEIEAGANRDIQIIYKAAKLGRIQNCARLYTADEQLLDESCFFIDVTEPKLAMNVVGPDTGVVGVPFTYEIQIENQGNGPAENIVLNSRFANGLEHQEKVQQGDPDTNSLRAAIGTLAAGESKVLKLNLVPRMAGQLGTEFTLSGDGVQPIKLLKTITVAQPQMRVSLSGSKVGFAGTKVEWNIVVSNPSKTVSLNNIVVRDPLPNGLTLDFAEGGGRLVNGDVVWDVGVLAPGQQRILQMTTICAKIPAILKHKVIATSDYGLREVAETDFSIEGLPALFLGAVDRNDPVQVNKNVSYSILVQNTGSQVAKNVAVTAILPKELSAKNIQAPEGSQSSVKGQVVTFTPVAQLGPDQQLVYEIVAQANKAGDVRFKMIVTSDDPKARVEQQESTFITDVTAPVNGAESPPLVVPNGPNGNTGVPTLPPPPAPPMLPAVKN